VTRIPDGAERDLTASAFVVCDGAVLLLHHSKLGTWLQPGGHVESPETPSETARRETEEETGIRIEFHPAFAKSDGPDESFTLPRPFDVNLHQIESGHWHCDFAYAATVGERVDATHADEHEGTRWFTERMLNEERDDLLPGTRARALEALRIWNETDAESE
jgi:8-oxo-dGTP pyrophosphatase MutT (NUDIX family)